jgi:putative ABC transport system permease protein
MNLVIRTAADPAVFAGLARSVVWSIDRDQPLSNVRTLEDIVRSSISQQYFNMRIMEVFALLALLLALVGIHGVLSYWVSQRTREIGIRMALGGERGEILTLVLGHGLSLVGVGLVLGLGLAFGLTRLISSLLYGVRATDSTTFVLLSLALGLVSLAACYVPARRATAIDPVRALRYE